MSTKKKLFSNILRGNFVSLEAIEEKHIVALEKYFSEDLTQYYPQNFSSAEEYFKNIVLNGCFNSEKIFAIRHNASGEYIGCSGYFNVDTANRKLEIGGTWVGKKFQGTPANVEGKFLLMAHALDDLKYLRVEFKTDSLNLKSQNALEKLGAKKEGVLRNHLILPSGRLRHSVYFSVIAEEWNEVKAIMTARIAAKTKQ
jgi:RimJ/RimL family protein N-acetyltransferase